jgi:hypothetical protein
MRSQNTMETLEVGVGGGGVYIHLKHQMAVQYANLNKRTFVVRHTKNGEVNLLQYRVILKRTSGG